VTAPDPAEVELRDALAEAMSKCCFIADYYERADAVLQELRVLRALCALFAADLNAKEA